jgi:hypothetical protein
MATTTPTFTWKPGGKPASGTDVWFLVARHTDTDRPEDELDRRARDLATIHRPDGDALHWRLRWGVLPWLALDRPVCVFCGRGWLCPPAAWAHARLSTLGGPSRPHVLEDGAE